MFRLVNAFVIMYDIVEGAKKALNLVLEVVVVANAKWAYRMNRWTNPWID